MNGYLLDSNFFIQAHRLNYPFDVVPSFWNKVKVLALNGDIISIDKVKAEILPSNDDLSTWCTSNLPTHFFKNSDEAIDKYSEISIWANSKNTHYKQFAISEFLQPSIADAWLISYALKKNLTIVTHETSDPNSKKRIKIPDVCIAHSIPYLNTIELFRKLGVQF